MTTVTENDRETWQAMALSAVRRVGRAPDDAQPVDVENLLATTTYDGLTVRPLYGPETEVPPPAPGMRTGGRPWRVRQRYLEPDPASLREDLAGGVTEVWLSGPAQDLLDEIDPGRVGVVLDGTGLERLLEVARRHGVPATALTGNLGADPLAERARTGRPGDLDRLVRLAAACVAGLPGLRAVTVDATAYHDAGGSHADVLACSIASGVEYLRLLTGAGLEVSDAFGQLEFRYAVGADLFDSIAVLRAARRLWARVARECGAPVVQRQHAVTSSAMMTVLSPSSNIMRTTVACTAAAIGGADAVTVTPFDALLPERGEPGRRLARNVHAVLREEAHLHRVADPAAGSWYVEQHTADLAGRAWAVFREIEGAGGMSAAVDSGLVAGRLAATRGRRAADLARRRPPIVGVSRYAEPGPVTLPDSGPGLFRGAEIFERLRARTAGARPAVLLVGLGRPAARTARVDFATDLFAVAGIETPVCDGRPEEVAAALTAAGTRVACLCGPDEAYADAERYARALTDAGAAGVWLAGRPAGPAGVTGYLFDGCDVVDVLERALKELDIP
ncbi:methylmalonyl-CoA mutase family protein [Actinoplanes regularis]|uniref:Heterodimeric methylmalonyl-CoA mutase small subunit n=1 Tax=Actinoplanes regularis TaxID=52697 RepID=A0A239IJ80_9ACTN|nr:methylmalonyl-CoA mutase family protein [Actinoplanes regularis]GIE91518.1 methylmalonyl-CoA mutase [Actinoplanes regularis]SNS93615.1 heterodimeric methylmalonyl-CoA mutase small subunit [Actinoplanes regularis]